MSKDELDSALSSDDPEERRRATTRLGETAHAHQVEQLLLALGDPDWRVRKEAISAARRAAPQATVLRGLLEAIGPGSNVGLRNAAVEALPAFGSDAVDAIAVQLPHLDADSRKLATEALRNIEHPTAFLILQNLTRDEDTNVRATAIEAVAQIGASSPEAACAILKSCLRSESAFERLAALDGLNQLGAVLPWKELERLLSDPVLERAALVAAGRTRSEFAVAPLSQALGTARGMAFEAALGALCELMRATEATERAVKQAIGNADPALHAKLLEVAESTNDNLTTRRMATLLLGCVASPAAAELAVTALADDSVTAEAEEALVLMGQASIDAVVRGLGSNNPLGRARSVDLLGRLFPKGAPGKALEAVSKLCTDDNRHVARIALETLGQLGDEAALSRVSEVVVDGDGAVRWAAETALAEIARRHPGAAQELIKGRTPQAPDAVVAAVVLGVLNQSRPLSHADEEFLIDVLAHESRFARRAALEALATAKTTRAVEAIAFALTDENREVQIAAIRTLGLMRTPEGRAVGLAHLLPLVEQPPDEDLLTHAVSALGDAGGVEAARALRPLTRNAPAPVAVAAIEAIARIPEIRHVDELIDGLSHPSPEVVKAALGVLAELNDPRVAAHVGACLDHEAWDVRRLAADLLGRLGGEANIELLRAKLHAEREPLVRDAVARALESLGALRRTPSPPGGSLGPR